MGFFMNNIYFYISIYIYIYINISKPETVCNDLSKQYLKNWKKVENFFFLKKEVLCQYFQNLIQHVSNE